MFVIVLSIGLVAGVVTATLLVYRWRIKTSMAALGMVLVAIVIASLPLTLSIRVALLLGLVMGFVVSRGVPGRGEPIAPEAPVTEPLAASKKDPVVS